MAEITLDVWLYGTLSRYGGDADQGSFASLRVRLSQGCLLGDALARIGMPSEERGITFINGRLSAMPGLQPDLGHIMADGDRVGFFDLRSMWPFQYRHGASLAEELADALALQDGQGIHHMQTPDTPPDKD